MLTWQEKKKLNENELAELISDYSVVIAGTEPITKKVMDCANNLKMISRVGIGLDSIELLEADKRGILVSYTPDAPTMAISYFFIIKSLNFILFQEYLF